MQPRNFDLEERFGPEIYLADSSEGLKYLTIENLTPELLLSVEKTSVILDKDLSDSSVYCLPNELEFGRIVGECLGGGHRVPDFYTCNGYSPYGYILTKYEAIALAMVTRIMQNSQDRDEFSGFRTFIGVVQNALYDFEVERRQLLAKTYKDFLAILINGKKYKRQIDEIVIHKTELELSLIGVDQAIDLSRSISSIEELGGYIYARDTYLRALNALIENGRPTNLT